MATFEPQFVWGQGVITEKALPIIIRSVNPSIFEKGPVIARIQGATEECQLQATTSTELAIKVHQYTTKVEVPTIYQKFTKIFSEEESK